MLYSMITTIIIVGVTSVPPQIDSYIYRNLEMCEIALDNYYENIKNHERVEKIDIIIDPIKKRRVVVTSSSHKGNNTSLGYTTCVATTNATQ